MQETDITDDTEAIAAKANERALLRTNELVVAARRFDGMTLPPDLARKFMLLKLNGSPTDPKLVAELTQVASSLDGMYGKGKYCSAAKGSTALRAAARRMRAARRPRRVALASMTWTR